MPTVNDLLRNADPLRHEPPPPAPQHERVRRSVVAAASATTTVSRAWFRAPLAVAALAALMLVAFLSASVRGPRGGATVYAAVRFEVRLAEAQPAAGLREARVAGSDRVIYLQPETVVTNDDIERCAAVTGSGASRFNIAVEFNAVGAEKMRRATAEHEGRPMAVLIDGEVVMAPLLRSPVGRAAVISGNYAKADAERIINGMRVR